MIRRGEFEPLNELAGGRGLVARLPAGDRGPVRAATGAPIGTAAFVDHLQTRYLS